MISAPQPAPSQGIVVAGSPYAVEVGKAILRAGGNAADGAIATALAMTVADPANISLFGRCHILVRRPDGSVEAIDGASVAPASTPPLVGTADDRTGFGSAALPGIPRALDKLHGKHGRLSLAEIAEPAADLAECGVEPLERLAAIWARNAGEIVSDPAAREAYLEGTADAPAVPKRLRHPRLAALIRAFGAEGAPALQEGEAGRRLAESIAANGGYWTADDLATTMAQEGEVIRGHFRDCEITTIGRQGWGHSLIQMLSMLDTMPRFGTTFTAEEAERLILTVLCAYADRPQTVQSLTPKAFGLPFETLVNRTFTNHRAAQIEAMIERPDRVRLDEFATVLAGASPGDQDTTHLSVIDDQGMAVAFTGSIGPHFGTKVAAPDHGIMLAHSYRMVADPAGGARDVTQMSPTIVTRNGQLLLSLGAAGSERIPGAVAQMIVAVVDRGLPLETAISFPRITIKDRQILVPERVDPPLLATLRQRGYPIRLTDGQAPFHVGIVHAAAMDDQGRLSGAADPFWDGTVGLV